MKFGTGIEKWLAEKTAFGAAWDLRIADKSRPSYLPYTATERWRGLQRLVLAKDRRGRKVLPAEAFDLSMSGHNDLEPRSNPGGAGDERQNKAAPSEDTYYTELSLPQLMEFNLDRPGDEKLALACLQNYQRALACYHRRRVKPATFAHQGLVLTAITKFKHLLHCRLAPIAGMGPSDNDTPHHHPARVVRDPRGGKEVPHGDAAQAAPGGAVQRHNRKKKQQQQQHRALDVSHSPSAAVAVVASRVALGCATSFRAAACGLTLSAPCLDLPFLQRLSGVALLDLSANNLTEVPHHLSALPALRVLYLHMNCIASLPALAGLEGLHLSSLTLHANPVQAPHGADGVHLQHDPRSYKLQAIRMLPQLRSLDHTAVTPADRRDAGAGQRAACVWGEPSRRGRGV